MAKIMLPEFDQISLQRSGSKCVVGQIKLIVGIPDQRVLEQNQDEGLSWNMWPVLDELVLKSVAGKQDKANPAKLLW